MEIKDLPVVINSENFFRQAINFTGLRWRQKLMPTDIDGFMEFNDKIFIFIESKFGDCQMPYGQRLALERVTDAIFESGRPSFCILASHCAGKDADVMLAKSIVTKIRHNKEWKDLDETKTVREVMDELLREYAPEYLD